MAKQQKKSKAKTSSARARTRVTEVKNVPGQAPVIRLLAHRAEDPEVGADNFRWPPDTELRLEITDPGEDHGFDIGDEYWLDLIPVQD